MIDNLDTFYEGHGNEMVIYLRAITHGKVEAFKKIVIEIIPKPEVFTGIADLFALINETTQAAEASEEEDEEATKSSKD
jgi:hypothetical protein